MTSNPALNPGFKSTCIGFKLGSKAVEPGQAGFKPGSRAVELGQTGFKQDSRPVKSEAFMNQNNYDISVPPFM